MTIEMLDVRGERLPRSRPPGTLRLSETVGTLLRTRVYKGSPKQKCRLEPGIPTGTERRTRSSSDKRGRGLRRWSMKVRGKVAIVTGAGTGIGSAVALRLAQEGAHGSSRTSTRTEVLARYARSGPKAGGRRSSAPT